MDKVDPLIRCELCGQVHRASNPCDQMTKLQQQNTSNVVLARLERIEFLLVHIEKHLAYMSKVANEKRFS